MNQWIPSIELIPYPKQNFLLCNEPESKKKYKFSILNLNKIFENCLIFSFYRLRTPDKKTRTERGYFNKN